jgi:hypothetical protein
MSGYLNYMQAKAHDAEIGERAERARPAREHAERARSAQRVRTSHGRPWRLRISMARACRGFPGHHGAAQGACSTST